MSLHTSEALPEVAAIEDLVERSESLPHVAHAAALVDVALRTGAEARAGAGTTMSLGAQLNIESPTSVVLYGTIGITPGLIERGQRQDAQSRAEADALAIRADAVRRDARRWAETALRASEARQREVEQLEDHTVPALEALVADVTQRRALGAALAFEAIDAQRRLAEALERLVIARARARLLDQQLTLLTAAAGAPR